VLLQEVWIEDDADRLLEAASVGGLEHGLHFKSGLFGSGLVTLSRYPIVHTSFHCYSTAGDPMAFACGDFYAGKGGCTHCPPPAASRAISSIPTP
jgi:sphingomyelin phosphodiesterase 2